MKFNKKNRGQHFQKRQFYIAHNPAAGAIDGSTIGRPQIMRRHHTAFPFIALSDDCEHKSFPISPDKISCFHGFSSLFTLQHRENFDIDGVSYRSVDQYYQIRKVKDLLGIECEKFTDGSANNYSTLARDLLKTSSVDRRTIDKWRVTCGVNVIQKALLEKTRQLESLRDALVKTGDKIIVHTYAADDFFGTGVPYKYVKDWCTGMEEKKVVVKLPMSYPLTDETLKNIPSIGKGRNVLGVIYTILREKINNGQLNSLNVDLIKFEGISNKNSLPKVPIKKDTDMEIDFTADYDPVAVASNSAETASSINSTSASNNAQSQKVKIKVKRTTAVTRASAKKAAAAPAATIGGTSTS